MQKLAILADIHGNLLALEAVLADLARQGVTEMICLGDAAAYGPQPAAVLRRLQQLALPVVMGNTDAWLLHPTPHPIRNEESHLVNAIELWSSEQLSDGDRAYIESFVPTLTLTLGGGAAALLAYHGSPRSYHDPIVATTEDEVLARFLAGHTAQIFAGGHTHTPFVRRFRHSLVLNPGSVGLPFWLDEAGVWTRPRYAEYAIIHHSATHWHIALRQVTYDISELARITYASGMPHAEYWLANWADRGV